MDEVDIADEPVRHQAFSGVSRIVDADGAAQPTPSGLALASVIPC
jgi:hypothetical protein